MTKSKSITESKNDPFKQLIEIMAHLRDPEKGCPWDRVQTHQSIIPNLLEETYEVIDAIEHGPDQLKDELGDLLLQIALHAQMTSEKDHFDLNDIATALNKKLIDRHPHVFGDTKANSAHEAIGRWEAAKEQQYTERKGLMDGIPRSFTALMRSEKIGKRAARIAFDWPDEFEIAEKVKEELGEFLTELKQHRDSATVEEEFGDLLFTLAQLARKLGFSAEVALEKANQKFLNRFKKMEELTKKPLKDSSRDELENLWQSAKTSLNQ